jgi:hypothetical protein
MLSFLCGIDFTDSPRARAHLLGEALLWCQEAVDAPGNANVGRVDFTMSDQIVDFTPPSECEVCECPPRVANASQAPPGMLLLLLYKESHIYIVVTKLLLKCVLVLILVIDID